MKLQVAVLLAMGLAGVAAWKSKTLQHSEFMETCDFEKLDGPDSQFCQGDLQVFYPELGDVGCTYIPKCHQYRKRISKEWRDPEIKYPRAEKNAEGENWERCFASTLSKLDGQGLLSRRELWLPTWEDPA